MTIKTFALAAVAVTALTLAGCGTLARVTGSERTVPDEFRVVTLAPLVVPPEYALRPPAPGEPRPQELRPESAARAALLGQRAALARTPGETAFVARAGADAADPLIRYVVDDEFGDLAHRERSLVDRILFWRAGQPAPASGVATTAQTGGTQVANIDPAAEAARLQALTGGQPVVIRRETRRTTKLPGL